MTQEKDILLIGSIGEEYDKNISKKNNVFNGAIAYLVTYLTKQGYFVDYINCIEDEHEKTIEKLSHNKYKLIGISTSLLLYMEQAKALVMDIKKLTDTKIVLGGIFIGKYLAIIKKEDPIVFQKSLKMIDADYFIDSYQGEHTLSCLLNSIISNTTHDKVPNIYYKENNKYKFTFTENENNILEYNTVDWNLIKAEDRKGKNIPIRTAQSCPFNCSFCTFKFYSGKYSCISIKAIEKELNSIGKNGIDNYIDFIDDTFNYPIDRFIEILNMIIKNKYNFKWSSFIRCQYLNDDIAVLMKKSGCDYVRLGIESGNQKILDLMNKQVKIDEIQKGINILKKHEIRHVGMFFIGFPGETKETVQDTVRFINESNLDYYKIYPWTNEPLAPIYEKKDIYGIKGIGVNWSHNTMNYIEANHLIEEAIKSIIIPREL